MKRRQPDTANLAFRIVLQPPRRQFPQAFQLFGKSLVPHLDSADQYLLEKRFVGRSVLEITAVPQHQFLIHRLFELMMALRHIPVFMLFSRVFAARMQTVIVPTPR